MRANYKGYGLTWDMVDGSPTQIRIDRIPYKDIVTKTEQAEIIKFITSKL